MALKVNVMKTTSRIESVEQLVNVMAAAKCGGQWVTIEGETPIKLNKFPTDGSERVKLADDFKPTKRFVAKFHFSEDYERKMAKVLGIDSYDASDSNREHLVKNVIMRYKSTNNVCLIYMPSEYTDKGIFVNGNEATADDMATIERYKSRSKNNAVVEYRTIGVKNVRRIAINNNIYEIAISEIVVMA